jgi:hypothetical protein
MALWSKKRQPPTRYVEPPEFRAGVVVLFDGSTWYLSALNAGDGRLPGSMPGIAAPTGERLAEEFRTSWLRARDGAQPVSTIDGWIRLLHGPELADSELPAAWGRFFAAGGAVFRIAPWPTGGIGAMRYGWGWPSTGNSPVWRSDKTGDNLAIDPTRDWRTAIDDADTWRQRPDWTRAAVWLRDRAAADPRVAAWWVADEDGAPRVPVMTAGDAVEGLRVWWAGDWFPTGAAIVERYGLAVPDGDGFWYGWLRWDPKRSPRADGLADVLGLRRTGAGVDVCWWPVESDGGIGRPVRAVGRDGKPLDIEGAGKLLSSAWALERRPPDVDWVEVGLR